MVLRDVLAVRMEQIQYTRDNQAEYIGKNTCGTPKLQMCWRCDRITDSSLSILSYWLHTLSISWIKHEQEL